MYRVLILSALVALAFGPSECRFPKKVLTSTEDANVLIGDEELSRSDALFLTPYIEAGKLKEGRELSEVKNLPNGGNKVKSFSGFLTVDKKWNSNIFFWFFPALNGQTKDVPVVLWLQGGPGGSSLFGLFVENGPLKVHKNLSIVLNNFSWNQEFSLLYIDQPVGTGYSFTDADEAYPDTEEEVARDLYEALRQFFTLFEEYRGNSFFLTGESYAGKYVPAIAYKIHKEGDRAKHAGINLQGLAIGDGWTDPRNQGTQYGEYLFQIGLIDEQQRRHFEIEEEKFARLIDEKQYLRAADIMNDLLNGNAEGTSYFQQASGLTDYYNYLLMTDPANFNYYNKYLGLKRTRKAIHVGNLPYNDGTQSAIHLTGDLMVSVKPWVEELLDAGYRTLFYSGQVDIIVAGATSENFLKKMHWKGAHKYHKAARKIYKVKPHDKEVAGYVRKVDNLYYALIRKAGHILPYDQPRVALDMITRFVKDEEF